MCRLLSPLGTLPLLLAALPALAEVAVPVPSVSHGLDALLLPIDASVRAAFGLAPEETGLLVLALDPSGVAQASGLHPGDVVTAVGEHEASQSLDLDTFLDARIEEGHQEFYIDATRQGEYVEGYAIIAGGDFWGDLDPSALATWPSWEGEAPFTYQDLLAQHGARIAEDYRSSEAAIMDGVATEEAEIGTDHAFDGLNEFEAAKDVGDEAAPEDDHTTPTPEAPAVPPAQAPAPAPAVPGTV